MKSTFFIFILLFSLALERSMAQQGGEAPPQQGGVALQQDVPTSQGAVSPQQGEVAPQQDIPTSQGAVSSQQEGVAPQQDIPTSQGAVSPQQGGVAPQQDIPTSQGAVSPQQGEVAPQQDIPTSQGAVSPQQGEVAPSPPVPKASQSAIASAWELEIVPLLQPFNYDGKERRNPFKPYQNIVQEDMASTTKEALGPILPLGKWDIDQIRLIGIIWSPANPKAMFEVPNKKKFILGKDERIGRNNGYIGTIRREEVVIVEPVIVEGKPNFVTRIMRLQK